MKVLITTYTKIAITTAKSYGKSGGIADESLRLFKTVISNNQEEKKIKEYTKANIEAGENVIKLGGSLGLAWGWINFVDKLMYILCIVVGSYLI
jgi:ABC-type multidrug transport system fused ATPase/permease subunit